ncbi:MAG TPA: hypothetical protein DIT48_11825 [Actinobacteria bacterium]|jgi:FtsH-binding integral membrane protein|nr:hypothetical protein [Actinomycetota bacterium]HCP61400.1 hypothetical protein [Actinomycetota bacterium]
MTGELDMEPMTPHQAAPRDQVGRAVGIVLLLGVALIHLLDAVAKFQETRYVFWLYIALMLASLVVAVVLLRTDSRLAWTLVVLASGATIVGFILSRTTGLPGAKDDIGNWAEPLGMASLFVEGAAFLLGLYKVASTPRIERGAQPNAIPTAVRSSLASKRTA